MTTLIPKRSTWSRTTEVQEPYWTARCMSLSKVTHLGIGAQVLAGWHAWNRREAYRQISLYQQSSGHPYLFNLFAWRRWSGYICSKGDQEDYQVLQGLARLQGLCRVDAHELHFAKIRSHVQKSSHSFHYCKYLAIVSYALAKAEHST